VGLRPHAAQPGETVLVTGDGLAAGCVVELARMDDGAPGNGSQAVRWPGNVVKPEVLQPGGHSRKFVLPADFAPGIVAMRIRRGEAVSETKLVNRPETSWCQGNIGLRPEDMEEVARPGLRRLCVRMG